MLYPRICYIRVRPKRVLLYLDNKLKEKLIKLHKRPPPPPSESFSVINIKILTLHVQNYSSMRIMAIFFQNKGNRQLFPKKPNKIEEDIKRIKCTML